MSNPQTEARSKRLKTLMIERPTFGKCSQELMARISARQKAGNRLGSTLTVGSILTWISGTPEELLAQGGVDLEIIANALLAIDPIIRNRVRADIFIAINTSVCSGKMTNKEKIWWNKVHEAIR